MSLYYYDGPVMAFDQCVANHWTATTWAVSERKARCNLTYRFKKETGKAANTRITLPGKIRIQERDEEAR